MNRLFFQKISLIFLMLTSVLACSIDLPASFPALLPTSTRTPRPTSTSTSTRTATPTRTSTQTPLPTATGTPTASPTALLYALSGTPLPAELIPLVPDNSWLVSGLAEWRQEAVTDIAWTPDGHVLAAADGRGIGLYDAPTRQLLRSLYPVVGGIVDIAFSPDGWWLVAGSRQGDAISGYVSSLELWLGPNWQPKGVLYNAPRGLSSMDFSSDSRQFAAAFASPVYEQNSVEIWNSLTWVITGTLQTGTALDIAFSPSDGLLAVTPDRYAIRIWKMARQRRLYNLHTSFTGAVNSMAFSPDGQFLATGHYDGVLQLWDMRTGKLFWSVVAEEVIESLAFSPDGKLLATGGSYQNSLVRLWSVSDGELLRTLEGHTHGVNHLLFSPRGFYLVSSSYDGALRLWGIRP